MTDRQRFRRHGVARVVATLRRLPQVCRGLSRTLPDPRGPPGEHDKGAALTIAESRCGAPALYPAGSRGSSRTKTAEVYDNLRAVPPIPRETAHAQPTLHSPEDTSHNVSCER